MKKFVVSTVAAATVLAGLAAAPALAADEAPAAPATTTPGTPEHTGKVLDNAKKGVEVSREIVGTMKDIQGLFGGFGGGASKSDDSSKDC